MHHLIIFISSDNIDYKLSLKVIQLKQQTKEDYWYCCLLTLDIRRSINTTRGNAITSFIMAKPTSRVCLFLLAYCIYTPRKNNWPQYFMQIIIKISYFWKVTTYSESPSNFLSSCICVSLIRTQKYKRIKWMNRRHLDQLISTKFIFIRLTILLITFLSHSSPKKKCLRKMNYTFW